VESKNINFAEEVLFYYVNKSNYFISEDLWVGLHQICWHNILEWSIVPGKLELKYSLVNRAISGRQLQN